MFPKRPPTGSDEEKPSPQPYRRPMHKTIGYIILLILGALYLANPGFGVVEFILDGIPIIGNLDEAGVASLMVLIIQKLRSGQS